jgi:hypothetical protein
MMEGGGRRARKGDVMNESQNDDVMKRTGAKACRWPLEAGIGKEKDHPIASPEGAQHSQPYSELLNSGSVR